MHAKYARAYTGTARTVEWTFTDRFSISFSFFLKIPPCKISWRSPFSRLSPDPEVLYCYRLLA